MNKKDAAIYLGISTRALEGHASKGELSTRYVKGRTGDVADYADGELRKLKAKLDSKRAARLADVQSGDLFQALLALTQKRKTQPQVNPSEKLMVTLKEAADIVSLSPAHLRDAINTKKLKGRIIGRGYKIKRADLDAYIKKL
jgi:excisionase family DNA binding protein